MIWEEKAPEPQWKKVKCSAGEFELLLRRPSYDEALEDVVSFGPRALAKRMEHTIVDWRGIETRDGKPVPFSPKNLSALIERATDSLYLIADAVSSVYYGTTTEQDEKNFVSPPDTGSSDGLTETPASTESSPSGDDSANTPSS